MDRMIKRNEIVISMDPATGEHLNADVLIEGPKMAAVAPNRGAVDAREIGGHWLPGILILAATAMYSRTRSGEGEH